MGLLSKISNAVKAAVTKTGQFFVDKGFLTNVGPVKQAQIPSVLTAKVVGTVGAAAVSSAIIAPVQTAAVFKYVASKPIQTAVIGTSAVVVAKSSALQSGIANIPKVFNYGTSYLADTANEAAALPASTKKTISEIISAASSGRELSTSEKQDLVDLLAKYGKVASIALGTAALFTLYKNTVGTQYYKNTDKDTPTPPKEPNNKQKVLTDIPTQANMPTQITQNFYAATPEVAVISQAKTKKTTVKKATSKKKAKKKTASKRKTVSKKRKTVSKKRTIVKKKAKRYK